MLLTAEAYEQMFKSLRVEKRGAEREKRVAPRVGLRVRIEIIPVNESKRDDPITVWTHDISTNGISLTTREPLIRDCRFLIEMPRKRGKPLTLLCVVKHCRALGAGQFRVGATQRVAAEDEIPPAPKPAPVTRAAPARMIPARSVRVAPAEPARHREVSEAEVQRIRRVMFE